MASKEADDHMARNIGIFKCVYCRGIHMRCEVDDDMAVVAVLDPDEWADMLMSDEDFRREAMKRLTQ